MAVYERTYRPYDGTRTPQWSRFLILPRYGLKRLFSSRIVLAYFVACQIPFLVGLAMVYITNNLELLQKIGIDFDADTVEFIGVAFFRRIFWIQGMGMGFLLMMIVGPGLISSDTANNALPLYFSRPFTRLEYVLGKASLPLLLMSGLTWIPQAILFTLQSSMREGWFAENVRLGAGLFVGSWVWIVVLTLITLAISASVKRKLAAMIYVFAVFMVLPIFGEMIHLQLGLWWGSLLSPIDMMLNALSTLYGGVRVEPDVPVGASWAAVAGRNEIVFEDVSKFYGEVLGVNRVDLSIAPGITSLVGPNGSGKSTLMNLMTGLLRPSRGRVRALGLGPDDPEHFFRNVGYCTQFDRFPHGLTGRQFVLGYLRVHGHEGSLAARLADEAIERVGLNDAAGRRVAGYSKGMRQRIKLAQAIAHHPPILVLDEPLNGLDPMARAEVIDLFKELAHADRHVIISSHILHEVDLISDSVVILNQGYVVAEGDIRGVRSEIRRHPMQILVRCDRATEVAGEMLRMPHVVEIQMHDDRGGLLVKTEDADDFYLRLNETVVSLGVAVDTITPADEDVHAVYRYLVSDHGEPS